MAERRAPADRNLAEWFRQNVGDGDTVHLAEGATYSMAKLQIRGLHRVKLNYHGARIKQPVTVAAGTPVLELIECTGWRIDGALNEGPWTPELEAKLAGEMTSQQLTAYYRARYGGHGINLKGCSDMLVVAPTSRNVWGDCYRMSDVDEGDLLHDVVLCDPVVDRCARHSFTTVQGTDIVVQRPHLKEFARTGFNFEVPAGKVVLRWKCEDARIDAAGLRTITATGEGAAVDVGFDGLNFTSTVPFSAEVYGEGAQEMDQVLDAAGEKDRRYPAITGREYGPREQWRIQRVRGARPPKAGRMDARFVCVEGLEVVDVPDQYPLDLRGSLVETA